MNEEILTAFKSVKIIKTRTNEALGQLNDEIDRKIAEEKKKKKKKKSRTAVMTRS